jgi:hypothetical protein
MTDRVANSIHTQTQVIIVHVHTCNDMCIHVHDMCIHTCTRHVHTYMYMTEISCINICFRYSLWNSALPFGCFQKSKTAWLQLHWKSIQNNPWNDSEDTSFNQTWPKDVRIRGVPLYYILVRRKANDSTSLQTVIVAHWVLRMLLGWWNPLLVVR